MKSRNYSIYLYIIVPVMLLAAFIVFYNRFQAEEHAKEEAIRVAAEAKAQADAVQQKEMERRLDEEAQRIATLKAEAIARKETEARIENERKIADLRARIEQTQTELARYKAKNAETDAKIKSVRAERIQTENQWLALAKATEEVRAEKSVVELESQRLMGVVMDRFDSQWKAILTAPPAPAAH